MKKLYTAADIEKIVSSGQAALVLNAGDILTPLARDRARELGLAMRRGHETTPAAPPSRPPMAAPGLAADALAAFIGLLHHVRDETADVPHLNRCFADLLQAVEQGDVLQPSARPEPVRLPPDRRQALVAQIQKLDALARYLFGPESSRRRYDILWALATAQRLTMSN